MSSLGLSLRLEPMDPHPARSKLEKTIERRFGVTAERAIKVAESFSGRECAKISEIALLGLRNGCLKNFEELQELLRVTKKYLRDYEASKRRYHDGPDQLRSDLLDLEARLIRTRALSNPKRLIRLLNIRVANPSFVWSQAIPKALKLGLINKDTFMRFIKDFERGQISVRIFDFLELFPEHPTVKRFKRALTQKNLSPVEADRFFGVLRLASSVSRRTTWKTPISRIGRLAILEFDRLMYGAETGTYDPRRKIPYSDPEAFLMPDPSGKFKFREPIDDYLQSERVSVRTKNGKRHKLLFLPSKTFIDAHSFHDDHSHMWPELTHPERMERKEFHRVNIIDETTGEKIGHVDLEEYGAGKNKHLFVDRIRFPEGAIAARTENEVFRKGFVEAMRKFGRQAGARMVSITADCTIFSHNFHKSPGGHIVEHYRPLLNLAPGASPEQVKVKNFQKVGARFVHPIVKFRRK
jgi:hypothetical protein